LIVDEAQSLSIELFEEVRLLANIETNDEKLLLVIIAGQPELVDRLNDNSLRQLKQRVALRCELRPLTLQETAAYLAGRIKAAGGAGAQVFTREAVTKIFESAHGIPRVTSVLADNSLLNAFAQGRRPVNSQMVEEVCADFDLAAIPRGAELLQPGPPDTLAAHPAQSTRILDLGATTAALAPQTEPTESKLSNPSDTTPRWRRFFEKRLVQR
jgi:general secretion pathway protein A